MDVAADGKIKWTNNVGNQFSDPPIVGLSNKTLVAINKVSIVILFYCE